MSDYVICVCGHDISEHEPVKGDCHHEGCDCPRYEEDQSIERDEA